MTCSNKAPVNAYKAFGLSISSDLWLPELSPLKTLAESHTPDIDTCNFDIYISEGKHLDWPTFAPSEHSTETLAMTQSEWRLELEEIGWFRAYGGNRIAWERWDDSVSDRDIRTFLVTSVLGALLIQRGSLLLNATTMTRDGKAIMLLGCPVSGKSTLAWCLIQNGWQLLSSEISYIDHNGLAWPGLQQLKLWRNSMDAFGLDWRELPVVRRGLKRYSLLPPLLPVAHQPVPLSVIYTVARLQNKLEHNEESNLDQSGLPPNPCSILALPVLSQRDALLQIRNQVFHPRFYRAMECEAGLFTHASSLVRQIRGYILRIPEGIERMSEALAAVDLLNPESIPRDFENVLE